MRILVDADACAVTEQIEKIAMKHGVRVLFYSDDSHRIRASYGRVITVETHPESVDDALIRRCGPGDVVITQDSGLAFRCIAKGAYVLHHNGWEYEEGKYVDKSAKKKRGPRNVIFAKAFDELLTRVIGEFRY